MKVSTRQSLAKAMSLRVAACGVLGADAETIARWRKEPINFAGESLSVSFLRHADEQTVVALRAVLAAVSPQGWNEMSFRDWGVIAAGNFLGRSIMAQTVERLIQEGAWGVSPHFIPHQSLHAMSGTISQALKIHGPNFGVSGGPNASLDAFLVASAMMMDRQLPGLWLVLSGHDSECIPPRPSASAPPPTCRAVALAMTHPNAGEPGIHVSVGCSLPNAGPAESLAYLPEFHISNLAEVLKDDPPAPAQTWRLGDTHWLEVETLLAAMEGAA